MPNYTTGILQIHYVTPWLWTQYRPSIAQKQYIMTVTKTTLWLLYTVCLQQNNVSHLTQPIVYVCAVRIALLYNKLLHSWLFVSNQPNDCLHQSEKSRLSGGEGVGVGWDGTLPRNELQQARGRVLPPASFLLAPTLKWAVYSAAQGP